MILNLRRVAWLETVIERAESTLQRSWLVDDRGKRATSVL